MAPQQALSASLQYISVEIGIPTSKQSQRSYQPTDRAAIRCFVCSSDLAAVYGMRLNRTRSSTTRSGRTPSLRSHKPRISTVNTHILAGIELGWLSPPSRGSSTCWLHSHRHLVAGRTLSRRRRAPPLAPPDASHCRLHKGSSVHPVLPLPTESFISTWSTNKEKPSQKSPTKIVLVHQVGKPFIWSNRACTSTWAENRTWYICVPVNFWAQVYLWGEPDWLQRMSSRLPRLTLPAQDGDC
jgi:hypothetical protein